MRPTFSFFDQLPEDKWIPRIVVECKLTDVSTHDALTYSAKSATHKHAHRYLRYGVLIGNHAGVIPWKFFRHGNNFDFIVAWQKAQPTESELSKFVSLVGEEIEASRLLATLLTDIFVAKGTYHLFHPKLVISRN